MTYPTYWDSSDDDDTTDEPETNSGDAAGIEALRQEVAELRAALSDATDAGEIVAVETNRRHLRERVERGSRAIESANDPATLAALQAIDNPEDLERFFREHGAGGGLL